MAILLLEWPCLVPAFLEAVARKLAAVYLLLLLHLVDGSPGAQSWEAGAFVVHGWDDMLNWGLYHSFPADMECYWVL